MADYTLVISDAEIARYRTMAQHALANEARQLGLAGVTDAALVADVGCGPAAMSVELAAIVGPAGRVIGVEREDDAFASAQQLIAQSGLVNVELRQASATDTGIAGETMDVAMCRHVLAHNGADEQNIVDHLASLVRSGGSVYLVDVDLTGIRVLDADPDLDDISDYYVRFHVSRGNDPLVGLKLGKLLAAAGLDVVDFTGMYTIVSMPPGMRSPAWAARDAMLAQGTVTQQDVDRWGAAFERIDASSVRPTIFAPTFVAVGRKP